jgi:hypothetical protein
MTVNGDGGNSREIVNIQDVDVEDGRDEEPNDGKVHGVDNDGEVRGPFQKIVDIDGDANDCVATNAITGNSDGCDGDEGGEATHLNDHDIEESCDEEPNMGNGDVIENDYECRMT